MRIIGLFAVLAALVAAGCVSVEPIGLAPSAAEALRGKEASIAVRIPPDFTAYSSSKALLGGGLIAGALMVEAGNRTVADNAIEDPSMHIARSLGAELGQRYQMRFTPDTPHIDSDDVAQLAKEHPTIDVLLDVRTLHWSYIYYPTSWNRYRVNYGARLRVIDLKRSQVIAEGRCSRLTDDPANAPSEEELLANGAQRLKAELKAAADFCVQHFRTDVFAFAGPATAPSAAPVAPLLAQAVAPADSRAEIVFWESIRASSDPADFRAYLEQYPQGTFSPLARNRLAALGYAVPAAPLPPKPASVATPVPTPGVAAAPAAAVASSGSRLPQEGDTWTYRLREPKRVDGPKERRYTATVAGTTGSTIIERYMLEGAGSGDWTHEPGSALVSPGLSLFAPYLSAQRPLPLAGRLPVEIKDSSCSGQYVCTAQASAVGRETIKVPAGTFETVKVMVEHVWAAAQQGGHPALASRFNGARRLIVWYAPDVKRAVKYSSRLNFGDMPPIDADFDLELESYQLK